MKALAIARVAAVAALLLLSWAGTARAGAADDLMLGGFRLSGEVEAGVREYIERPPESRRAKFQEYEDMRPGLFLNYLRLSLQQPDGMSGMDLYGTRWGFDDQRYEFNVGRLGLWEMFVEWDQIPHVYYTTARWLATETGRGIFTLPSVRPPLNAHNSAPSLDEIALQTNRGLIGLKLTPTPDVEVTTSYQVIRREGNRDFSMAFGSPGNNFYGILEPIDQTTHDFRVGVAIAREQWQAQFGYMFSYFANANRWVRADNPCFPGAPAGCAANDFAAGSPITGQTSLPPNNMAHTFTGALGVNLPLRTRINTAFTYSLYLQNDTFLPHTINPAITSSDLVLPQRSLNGIVQNFIGNFTAVSRPFGSLPLTLTAKYRIHDFQDVSDQITFPGFVLDDKTPEGARRAGRWSWIRQNADLEGRYQLFEPAALTIGVDWQRWDRNAHREVPVSDEFGAKAALDVTPFDWLLARLTYRPSFLRIERYNSAAHAEHAVAEDPVTALQGQSVLLRKFDEAERNIQSVTGMLQFTPLDRLSISPVFGYRWVDYIASRLGLQQEQAWNVGVDFAWTPVDRVTITASYSHERDTSKMRSRSRPVTGTGATLDFVDFDWVSNIADTIDSFTLNVRTTLIPSKLDWIVSASYQYALGRIDNSNPIIPKSGTAAQNLTATAQPWPAFEDELATIETALRYYFTRSWSASVFYSFQTFRKQDWRTDTLNPFMGPDAVWMANDSRNYTAHIIGASLAYRFGR
jgi:MtrB/PioB family decaheme-associated outer membrane protein